MKKRLFIVIAVWAAVLGLGLAYAWLITHTGLRVPCLFLILTGHPCPTCGVSRMFLSLMRLDFAAAFRFNPVIFCLLPVAFAVVLRLSFRYVRTGRLVAERWMLAAAVLAVISLIAFGIFRFLF